MTALAMRIRPWSHLGWLMLQWLGVLVPGAFRDEVRRAAQAQGKSVYQRIPTVEEPPLTCPMCGGPATKAQLDDPHGCCEDCYWRLPDGSVGDRQDRPEVYARLESADPESLVKAFDDAYRQIGANGVERAMGGGMLAALRRDDAKPARELWWLSFANDVLCVGVALVWLDGEQTLERAAQAAADQGIAPQGGPWEVFGCEVPEDERTRHEAYAGRLLTTHEAAAVFGAKRLGDWEDEFPEVVQALCEEPAS